MNLYWAFGVLMGFMLWTCGTLYVGYHWSDDVCQTEKTNELNAEISARLAAEKKAEDISSAFEASKTQNQTIIAQLLTETRQSHAKNPVPINCIIPSDRMQQIHTAISSSFTGRFSSTMSTIAPIAK